MLDRVHELLGTAEREPARVEGRAAVRVARVVLETLCERMTEVEVRAALEKSAGRIDEAA